jgi:glucose-6-phosphate 1-dehydrogenase
MYGMHSIIIFGASGDLTGRKLIPALYQLFLKKRLPAPVSIVGFARTAMDDGAWRDRLAESTARFAGADFSDTAWGEFAPLLHYHAGNMEESASFAALARCLDRLEEGEAESHRLYYLATAPKFYGPSAEKLGEAGLAAEGPGRSRRIVIEKPFGTDLASAQRLNETVFRSFNESQIYRIDHYLGKETVNNVLVLRFANAIFEPIWNRNYIESIQITANEDVLVGRRAPYYESAGVLRDMFQNHLLQLLSFVTMEPPARFDAKAVRDEKVKVLQSIRAMTEQEAAANSIRGQYRSYRDEEGVAKTSRTATFGALRLFIDNWRWKGVPVFLRSGKGMGCRTTQVLINFREPPHRMFQSSAGEGALGNRLLIQIQPAEGIQLYFATKIPDTDMKIRVSDLSFNFRKSFRGEMPDSYERLLLDALSGDASLFARSDEVEAAWRIIDPVQKTWDGPAMGEPEFYETGSTGPVQGDRWIESFGERWLNMCPIV